jgi:hypothetical protein
MAITFTRQTIRRFTRIGLLVALLSWPVVWGFSTWLSETRAAAAERIRTEGVEVQATPLSIAGSLGWQKRDIGYDFTYRFTDKAGRTIIGSDQVRVSVNSVARGQYEAMRDTGSPNGIRPDARITVVYLPSKPEVNGMRLRFDSTRVPDGSWAFMAGFGAALVLGAVVIGVGSFMEKRFRPG